MNSLVKKLIPFFINKLSVLSPYLASRCAFELFCRPVKTNRAPQEKDFWQSGVDLNLPSGRAAKSWGEGPMVWLLHGWGSRGSTFYKIVPDFVKAGFQVVAWDGPAHGDSPEKKVNIIKYAQAVADDLKFATSEKKLVAVVGHSFGGASLAVLNRFMTLPTHLVIIGSPTEIPIVFSNFKRLIRLGDRAFELMVAKAEKIIGGSISSTSLLGNDLSKQTKVLIIHDEKDKEVPFQRFEKLKNTWSGGEFYSTQGLGHRRIIKSSLVAKKIIGFIQ